MKSWLIYGATGYSGRLIAETAAKAGMKPVLAGRSASVEAIASGLGLEARIFDLADTAATLKALSGIHLVLNCAGPFSATAAPMIDACLQVKAHYLDITGEIAVFEHARSRDADARSAGVILCPGVGFDVIPTDCVAAALKAALPDATDLALGFDTASGLSPGTTKTMIEGLPDGGKARRAGKILTVPSAAFRRVIDFGYGAKYAMSIPWGDVSTAFHTTGISNITTFIANPKPIALMMRATSGLARLFGRPGIQRWLKGLVDRHVKGPDEEARKKLRTAVWGEARNAAGEIRTARIETANGYQLTIDGALAMAGRVIAETPQRAGYQTPAGLYGPRLVESLPGSGRIILS
ncbi:saccharopine dehydrogenase family protein [Pseudokordiimonas caeni]|uniref:saccharopine dehydrogenase family protein n=1 Tax=Pseudokordiimonas caeni TaxID=2997908 RepID=UPI0028116240|nr:saccharopine dehydrogenase NADP-binding domain-containing protein [Pseudokordiimonas caeni]